MEEGHWLIFLLHRKSHGGSVLRSPLATVRKSINQYGTACLIRLRPCPLPTLQSLLRQTLQPLRRASVVRQSRTLTVSAIAGGSAKRTSRCRLTSSRSLPAVPAAGCSIKNYAKPRRLQLLLSSVTNIIRILGRESLYTPR